MLIDSHCHLDFPELTSDEAGVLARAKTAGVAGMLTIGTRLDQFDRVRAIGKTLLQFRAGAGRHLDCIDLHHGHGVRLPAR